MIPKTVTTPTYQKIKHTESIAATPPAERAATPGPRRRVEERRIQTINRRRAGRSGVLGGGGAMMNAHNAKANPVNHRQQKQHAKKQKQQQQQKNDQHKQPVETTSWRRESEGEREREERDIFGSHVEARHNISTVHERWPRPRLLAVPSSSLSLVSLPLCWVVVFELDTLACQPTQARDSRTQSRRRRVVLCEVCVCVAMKSFLFGFFRCTTKAERGNRCLHRAEQRWDANPSARMLWGIGNLNESSNAWIKNVLQVIDVSFSEQLHYCSLFAWYFFYTFLNLWVKATLHES